MRNQKAKLYAALWLVWLIPAWAGNSPNPHVYPSNLAQVLKLGGDLYETLDAPFQKSIYPRPVQVEQMEAPIILPVEGEDQDKSLKAIKLSVGYIDLMNHIAHAAAIDKVQKGYFQQYIVNICKVTDSDALPDPPNMVDNRYWTDDVMNDQASFFNQLVGFTMALNLTHHYLGHYSQFSAQMLAGKLVPINTLLTPAQWEATVKAATLNALNTALGSDGPKALFDALDKIPKRPAWASYIVPPTADLKKINKELKKYEDQFFHGGLTLK